MIYKDYKLEKKSNNLLSCAFEISNLWNKLHSEYEISNFIDFQIGQMISNMFSKEQKLHTNIIDTPFFEF